MKIEISGQQVAIRIGNNIHYSDNPTDMLLAEIIELLERINKSLILKEPL